MTQKIPLSLDEIEKKLSSFQFPEVDIVIGIASGGVYPAKIISQLLKKPKSIIEIKFRSLDNSPLYKEPKLIRKDVISDNVNRILLVDDVSVSGKTINLAKTLLKGYTIFTLVFKGHADYVLFPDINTCVSWPWHIQDK